MKQGYIFLAISFVSHVILILTLKFITEKNEPTYIDISVPFVMWTL